MDKIIAAVEQEINSRKKPLLIAIDGRCASGKTTAAEKLRKLTGCTVIHTDHFFLRPEQRTEARLALPGENIDHERLKEEVLLPLSERKPFSYREFDCGRMELAAEHKICPADVTVIEGSYSCHPMLWEFYDLHIFLTADYDERLRRIERRSGSEKLIQFKERWIPLEEKYFAGFKIEERCELVFGT